MARASTRPTARPSRSTNPATGRVIATAPLGGREDVDRAVAAAQKAFEDRKGWANWAAGKRGRSLSKLAALIKQNSEELSQLETANVGKPITSSRGEVIGASLVFDYYAGAANKVFGQTIPVSKPGLDLTLREPIGVVGLIVPWNFPLYMASWKVAPALAAGNTAILKPASYTPLTAHSAGRAGAGGRDPGGRPERRHRAWRDRGCLDRRPSGDRQGRVHRRDDHGPGDHAAGLREREEDLAGARRQEPEHRLCRRRPREVREGVAVQRLRQLRPGLLRSEPDPRRTIRPRAGRGAVRRGHAERQGRRSARRRDGGRDARQHEAARPRRATTSRSARPRARRSSSAAPPRTTRPWPPAPT